jgi:hypothetical protein
MLNTVTGLPVGDDFMNMFKLFCEDQEAKRSSSSHHESAGASGASDILITPLKSSQDKDSNLGANNVSPSVSVPKKVSLSDKDRMKLNQDIIDFNRIVIENRNFNFVYALANFNSVAEKLENMDRMITKVGINGPFLNCEIR